ncbi:MULTISPECIES: hypothetical protein [Protofrankia]|uniref:Uncharacterized protein n=1 Tax=Protofrankia coriariae TaxID=1562887 RepID=A0ABR5F550_9ACTN|nr:MULTISPECIES: hypothetical protein [Protofrankia]KLL11859.1 hypothetical protein FrCorBMG51_08530 [Protofrankia coriariae]ONH34257.1 hypothetical protein BL254_17205 [Protofrankia sp. BMG5.30]
MTTPILPDFPPVDPAFVEPTVADLTEASGRVAQYGPNAVRVTTFMLVTDALTGALTRGSMSELVRSVRQLAAVDRAVIAYQRGELITGEAGDVPVPAVPPAAAEYAVTTAAGADVDDDDDEQELDSEPEQIVTIDYCEDCGNRVPDCACTGDDQVDASTDGLDYVDLDDVGAIVRLATGVTLHVAPYALGPGEVGYVGATIRLPGDRRTLILMNRAELDAFNAALDTAARVSFDEVPAVPPAVAEYAVMRTADGDVTLTATVQPADADGDVTAVDVARATVAEWTAAGIPARLVGTDGVVVPPAVAEYAVVTAAGGDVTLISVVDVDDPTEPAAAAESADAGAVSAAVLDGVACLFCGADLTVPGVVSVPAGVVDGRQVFACQMHTGSADGDVAEVTR